jgi:hypothetical protein
MLRRGIFLPIVLIWPGFCMSVVNFIKHRLIWSCCNAGRHHSGAYAWQLCPGCGGVGLLPGWCYESGAGIAAQVKKCCCELYGKAFAPLGILLAGLAAG